MTLLVRDEIDIVARNIAFHLAAGVDHVIVTDNGSVDGTRDVLSQYERSGVVTVLDEPGRDFAQGEWVTRMALLARDRFGADWILNNDADEFWVAQTGDLKSQAVDAELLTCRRRNMVAAYDMDERTPWFERVVYRVGSPNRVVRPKDIITGPLGLPFFYFAPLPKVLVRANGLKSVTQGNHSASFASAAKSKQADIVIYHYPFRTLAQFERKILQGGRAYLNNPRLPPNLGWHWRRWYAKLGAHGLESVLKDAMPTAVRLREDVNAGILIQDAGYLQAKSRRGLSLSGLAQVGPPPIGGEV